MRTLEARRAPVGQAATVAVGCAFAAVGGTLAVRSSEVAFAVVGFAAFAVVLIASARRPAGLVLMGAVVLISALIDIPQKAHLGATSGQGAETLVLVLVMMLLCMNGYGGRGVPELGRLWPLALFLVWAMLSFAWGSSVQQGLQNVLVYVAFAGIMVIAAAAGRWSGETAYRTVDRCFRAAAVLGCGLYVVSIAVSGTGNRAIVSPRPFALFAVLVVAWFMASYANGNRRAGWFVAAAVLVTLLSLSRSALAAQLVLVLTGLIGTTTNFRTVIRTTAALTALLLGAAAAVTFYAPLHNRFFSGDTSSVGGVSVNVTGRDTLWSANWHWFTERPLVGWGAGSSDRMTSELPGGFAAHPHNDYLRLMVDFGGIGLGLWLIALVVLLRLSWHNWRVVRRAPSPDRHVACAAFLGLVGVALTMLVDNPLIEVGKMAPLGVIIGLALGMAAGRRARSAPRAIHQVPQH